MAISAVIPGTAAARPQLVDPDFPRDMCFLTPLNDINGGFYPNLLVFLKPIFCDAPPPKALAHAGFTHRFRPVNSQCSSCSKGQLLLAPCRVLQPPFEGWPQKPCHGKSVEAAAACPSQSMPSSFGNFVELRKAPKAWFKSCSDDEFT